MTMGTRGARSLLWIAFIVGGVVLLADLAYFVRGSLEMFPTPEDHAKVRTVAVAIAIPLAAIELALWRLLRRAA